MSNELYTAKRLKSLSLLLAAINLKKGTWK